MIKKANKKNVFVIIDEAYIDFSNQKSCSDLVKKFKNLIILKTFSKSMGIAGLRIGYTICNFSQFWMVKYLLCLKDGWIYWVT